MAEVRSILKRVEPLHMWNPQIDSEPMLAAAPELPDAPRNLERLIESWNRNGHDVPIAIVVSIFDDLCAELNGIPDDRNVHLRLSDVFIDPNGRAHLIGKDAARAGVSSIVELFAYAIGPDIPLTARAFLLSVIGGQPLDGPQDHAQFREWLRMKLTVAAQHDEVAQVFELIENDRLSIPPLEDQPTLEPANADFLLPMLDPVSMDLERATVEALDPRDTAPPMKVVSDVPSDAPVSDTPISVPPPASDIETKTQIDTRPVIRHHLARPSVRLDSAPAARSSAKALPSPRDRLYLDGGSSRRVHWALWLVVIAMLATGALFWSRFLP